MKYLLPIVLLALSGCTVIVDKRTYVFNAIDAKSTVGHVNVTTSTPVTNTSDTKTDAKQAIDGALSIPLVP